MSPAFRSKSSTGPSPMPIAGRNRQPKSPLDKANGYELDWDRTPRIFEVARGINNVSFVYFIGERDNGPLKIGKAVDPINRLRAMQTGNPRGERSARGCLQPGA